MHKRRLAVFIAGIAMLTGCTSSQNNHAVQVVFSPQRGATQAIVKIIDDSQHSIKLAAYSFTSKSIANALVAAHNRNVTVKALLDKSNVTAKYSAAKILHDAGIEVRINYKYSIMHNKFIIIDNKLIETGSFNYTSAAENKNAENIIILRNAETVAKQFNAQWQQLWREGQPYNPRTRYKNQ